MRFKDIQGYDTIKQRLIAQVEHQRMHHAQLFIGPEGSPNLALALAFATFIHCQDRQPEDACGQCESCVRISKFIHPDLHFVFPVGPTKDIKNKEVISARFLSSWRDFLQKAPYGNVADWRQFLGDEPKQLNISKEEVKQIIRNLSLKTFGGGHKIMVIWLPEFMQIHAANALLKIIEEPPPKTIFLLVSFNVEHLLPTVLSRTQQLAIGGFPNEDMTFLLNEKFPNASPEKVAEVAVLAEGNLQKAMKMMEETDNQHFGQFKDWMRRCYTQDFEQLTQDAESFQQINKDRQKAFFLYCLHMLREALVIPISLDAISRLNQVESDFIQKFTQSLSIEKIEEMAHYLEKGVYHIDRNAQSKLLYMATSIGMGQVFRR